MFIVIKLKREQSHQRKALVDGDAAWDAVPDGPLAKMLLFDQIARNVFRGTPRAFAYDDKALAIARSLAAGPHLTLQHVAYLHTHPQLQGTQHIMYRQTHQ